MRFTCSQEELSRALAIVGHAIASNNTLPVLDNVYLKVEGTRATVIATDLELAIEYFFEPNIEAEGSITIPAKLLSSYVNLLPAKSEITVGLTDGDTVTLEAKGSHTKIKGLPAKDFPALPEFSEESSFGLPSTAFTKAVSRVLFAASQNASRPILSGVCFTGSDTTLKVVATDSYRLAESTITLEQPLPGEGITAIIPAKTMQDVMRIFQKEMDSITLHTSRNQVLFTSGKTRVISRLIEGRFPEYSAIIPKQYKSKGVLTTYDFLNATKRVNLFAKENNFNLKVETKATENHVILSSDSTEIGQDETQIPGSFEGEDTVIALNARYLIDVLTNMGTDEIAMEVDSALSPAVIRPQGETDYIHIIMPLKLN